MNMEYAEPAFVKRYRMERRKWLVRASREARVSELVVTVSGIIIGFIAGLAITIISGAPMWATILSGIAGPALGGVAAYFGFIIFYWMIAPVHMAADVDAEMETLRHSKSFTDQLRDIRDSIGSIELIGGTNDDALKRGNWLVMTHQLRVMRMLWIYPEHWKNTPDGWSDEIHPLLAWGAMSQVLAHRYPEHLLDIEHLYEETEHGLHILPEQFQAVKMHSMKTIDMLIREIEEPDGTNRDEEPGLFKLTLLRFTPPVPYIQHSQPEA